MDTNVFLPAKEALKRYGRSDVRTLQSWTRKGYILYQVICPESSHPVWYFESPEARYQRTLGIV